MPVHAHFLVEKGIHIIEALDLEKLAADGIHEFVFVAIPLKIAGGTGCFRGWIKISEGSIS